MPGSRERDEIAGIQTAAGLSTVSSARPFRAPHHSCSHVGQAFGLAMGGVLFLDEIPEFRRAAIDEVKRLDAAARLRTPGRDSR